MIKKNIFYPLLFLLLLIISIEGCYIGGPSQTDWVSYYSVCWMPDSQSVVYIKKTEHIKFSHFVSFSDSNISEVINDYQICIFNIDSGKEKIIKTIKHRYRTGTVNNKPVFKLDSSGLNVLQGISNIDVNPVNGDILIGTVYSASTPEFGGPAFLYSNKDSKFRIVIEKNIVNPRWAQNGQKIIYAIYSGTFRLENSFFGFDLVSHRENKLFEGHPLELFLSPNSEKIVWDRFSSKYKHHMIMDSYMVDVNSSEKIEFPYVQYIVWSPDNNKIALNSSFPLEDENKRYKDSIVIGTLKNNRFIEDYVIEDSGSPVWNFDGTGILYSSCSGNSKHFFDITSQKKEEINFEGSAVKWLSSTTVLCVDRTKGFYTLDFVNKKILLKNNIFSDNRSSSVVPYSSISVSLDGRKILGKKIGVGFFVMDLANLNYKIFAKDYKRDF